MRTNKVTEMAWYMHVENSMNITVFLDILNFKLKRYLANAVRSPDSSLRKKVFRFKTIRSIVRREEHTSVRNFPHHFRILKEKKKKE